MHFAIKITKIKLKMFENIYEATLKFDIVGQTKT